MTSVVYLPTDEFDGSGSPNLELASDGEFEDVREEIRQRENIAAGAISACGVAVEDRSGGRVHCRNIRRCATQRVSGVERLSIESLNIDGRVLGDEVVDVFNI